MKRGKFRQPTLDEVKEKQAKKRAKMLSKPKVPRKAKKRSQSTTGRKKARISPRLGINNNAKQPTYKGITSTGRYKGLKGMAWTLCSLYIRHRDNFTCVTCGNSTHKAQQAGHYWPAGFVGSNNKLSWDEMNIHCQCKGCNEDYGGLQKLMAEYIDRKYGEEVRLQLDQRRWKTDPVENWEDMIMYYEEKLKPFGVIK